MTLSKEAIEALESARAHILDAYRIWQADDVSAVPPPKSGAGSVIAKIDAALSSSPGKDGGQEVEAVPDRGETCPHCKGEGCQPGDPEGAPLEACDYCNGSGKKISTQPASTALVERLTKALEPFCKHYEPWMERWDDQEASSTFSRHTFGDLREALAAINEARAALSTSTSREGER